MIYAVIKLNNGNEYKYLPLSGYYKIYDRMMEITDGDHEESSNAASWCELSTVGETYYFREGVIEMIELS